MTATTGGNGGAGQGFGNKAGPTTGDPPNGSGASFGNNGAAWGTAATTGAAGKAVQLNGFLCTFLRGNNSSQVKGAVS